MPTRDVVRRRGRLHVSICLRNSGVTAHQAHTWASSSLGARSSTQCRAALVVRRRRKGWQPADSTPPASQLRPCAIAAACIAEVRRPLASGLCFCCILVAPGCSNKGNTGKARRTIDGDSSGKPGGSEQRQALLNPFHSASRLASLDSPHRQPDSLPHFHLVLAATPTSSLGRTFSGGGLDLVARMGVRALFARSHVLAAWVMLPPLGGHGAAT